MTRERESEEISDFMARFQAAGSRHVGLDGMSLQREDSLLEGQWKDPGCFSFTLFPSKFSFI